MKTRVKILPLLITFLILLAISPSLYQFFTTKAEKLDKIYILNLDRSVDRYKKMQEQLDSLNLAIPYTRFAAIDGRKIKLLNIETHEDITGEEALHNQKLLKGDFNIICSDDFTGNFNPVKLNLTHFHPRTIGEVGCACSHKEIWQKIVNNNYQNTLILEDDVTFIPNFTEYLQNAMLHVPKDYDYIYISALLQADTFKIKKENKFIQSVSRFISKKYENPFFKKARRNILLTAGYIISKQGAQKLLNGFTQYLQVDEYIRKMIEENNLSAYVTNPFLLKACYAGEAGCDTTIGEFPNNTSSQDLIVPQQK